MKMNKDNMLDVVRLALTKWPTKLKMAVKLLLS